MAVDSIGSNYYVAQQYPQRARANQQQTNPSSQQAQNVEVAFCGNGEEKKNDHKALKIAVGVAVTAVGVYFLHKNWDKISKWAKGLFNGKASTQTTTKSEKALQKAKNKIFGMNTGKAKIKHTSVTGAAKTATEASKAKVVETIVTQNANSSSRKLVEQAAKEVVSPEAQKAYDAAIAYVAPNATQKRALAELASANKAQRATANALSNAAKGGEKLEQVAQQVTQKVANQAAAAKRLVANVPYQLANGNSYVVDNAGNIVKVILKVGHELTEPIKVPKHLAKNNITIDAIKQTILRLAA